ncbi:MAG: hypothetical protein JST30_03965 [Armatimonadetes bacterium]|nr:hypothetical protein [Armatimonadota bacterium]
MSPLGTFSGGDLNVIGWSPYTGHFVAHSSGGATEYTQSGRALVSYRGAFVRAAFTPLGLLLTGPNPVSAHPADRTCLAKGGTLTDIRKGKMFAASASGQYLVFKESDVYKLFRVPS